MRIRTALGAACALAALLAHRPAQAQYTYQITSIPAGAYITGINDYAWTSGYYQLAQATNGAFVRSQQAQYYNYSYPGANYTSYIGMNSNGGLFGTANIPHQGTAQTVYFYQVNGTTTVVSPPGNPGNGLNNNAQIAGLNPGNGTGFIQTIGGGTTTYAAPSVAYSIGGINDYGWTAGSYPPSPGLPYTNGYIRSPGGAVTTYSIPGSQGYQVTGMNNAGQVLGSNLVPGPNYSQRYQGVLRNNDGSLTTINVAGSMNTYVGGLNNNGVIAGTAIMPDGTYVAFFAYPPGYNGPRAS